MIFGSLSNMLAHSAPPLSPTLTGLPWYIPPRSQASRQIESASLAMGPGIFGSFGDAIDAGSNGFARIARHYQAEGGMLGDPAAAPVLTLTPGIGARAQGQAGIDLGEGYALLLDAATDQILVAHHPTGALTHIWGGDMPLFEQSWFGLDNGTSLAIETMAAPGNANGFEPGRIDVTQAGRSVSLRAVETAL